MVTWTGKSSMLKKLSYDSDTKTMRATFMAGSVYDYEQVPPVVAKEVFFADSVGGTFTKLIKTGDPYKYKKITAEVDLDIADLPKDEYLAKVARGTKG